MKNTYYFSHDSNARNDEKILMLRAEHGWEGYGLFWALIEMMFENTETSLTHKKIKGIAASYNIDITLLQNVIDTAISEGLFFSDGEKFWSESLRRRKNAFYELKEKRSKAGKKGMDERWKKPDGTKVDNTVITKDNKGKESKVNKSKENKNIKDIYTHEFEIFYSLYPNPFNKEQTFKNWKTCLKSDTIENIMLATNNYLKYLADNKTDKQYITRSTNFLGQKQEYKGYLDYKPVIQIRKVADF